MQVRNSSRAQAGASRAASRRPSRVTAVNVRAEKVRQLFFCEEGIVFARTHRRFFPPLDPPPSVWNRGGLPFSSFLQRRRNESALSIATAAQNATIVLIRRLARTPARRAAEKPRPRVIEKKKREELGGGGLWLLLFLSFA